MDVGRTKNIQLSGRNHSEMCERLRNMVSYFRTIPKMNALEVIFTHIIAQLLTSCISTISP